MRITNLPILLTFTFLNLISLATAELACDPDTVFHYDFASPHNLTLHGGATVEEGVLKLDGTSGYATVPQSQNHHLTSRGLTLIAVIKTNPNQPESHPSNAYDMYLAKGSEFIFGKHLEELYVNLNDGKRWVATTLGKRQPKAGEWTHLTAVIQPVKDPPQGDAGGFRISIFMNGDLVIRTRFQNIKSAPVPQPIEIGRGFGGGPWHFRGDIAEVAMINRPLKDYEIARLASKCPRIKSVPQGFVELNQDFLNQLAQLTANASPQGTWLLNAIRRLGATGYPQNKLLNVLHSLHPESWKQDLPQLAKALAQKTENLTLIITSDMAILTALGQGRGAFPLGGILDRRAQREILGDRGLSWQLDYRRREQGQAFTADSNHQHVSWQAEIVSQAPHKTELLYRWTGTAQLPIQATAIFTITDRRLESTFSTQSNAPELLLDHISYPVCNLAPLHHGKDVMVYPWMSGILVPNPLQDQFLHGQDHVFPSGKATMQFGAYYDDLSGIYVACEDPLARTKRYSAVGKRNNLNLAWKSPIPVPQSGISVFQLKGKAVIELYTGAWFEAGQIYRRFLTKNANWWIPDLPRTDTPDWFRNNTLWILGVSHNSKQAEEMVKEATYLRNYFELPFGIHWYYWDDEKLGYPHYQPKAFFLETNKILRSRGIRTMPYIDSRIWACKDGQNKTDFMFSSHGLKYAVRDNRQAVCNVNFSNVDYAVMCPASEGWQTWIANLTRRIASYGTDAIYHDEVATASPILCFSTDHGHPQNSGATWLEYGYGKLFHAMRKALKPTYPHFCHTTEEASDPYLKAMDGYMVWRWTDNGQIPLFQSIYSGRIQFVGRLFDHQKKGDAQSFFSKVAQQLVNSEQIGWFPFWQLRAASEQRKFVKKCIHLRQALLPYFNSGRMAPPLTFQSPVPYEHSLWGSNFPQRVRMPKIASSGFLRDDGSAVFIFINTTDETVTVQPQLSLEGKQPLWICQEGAEAPIAWQPEQKVIRPPRTAEIWICGTRQEADRIQNTMRRIATFTPGRAL